MARLAAAGGIGGGEGIDAGFRPDRRIGEGAVVAGPGWTLTALATPGHTADHLSFAWAEGEGALLRRPGDGLGDDADLAARRRSRRRSAAASRRLQARGRRGLLSRATARRCATRRPVVGYVLAHRAAREAEILAALARGPATVPALVAAIYAGVDPRLHPAAARNVLAHLIDLADRGLAAPDGPRPAEAGWRLTAAGRAGAAS